jgi:double-strand break repair protein MRE11
VIPSEAILASMDIDNIRVEKLVHEFLAAQSLKVLPQGPFGDAVKQFVDKDDKLFLNEFVKQSLTTSVSEMMTLTAEEVDLDPIMERIRVRQETQFAAGNFKRPNTKGKLKPRPHGWDSDLDGEWEDQPGAFEFIDAEDDEDETLAPAARRGNNTAALSDDNASVISTTKVASKTAATKKAPAKKAPAKPKAPVKAKAPAKAPTRGRKKVVEPSDDEDEDDDVVMLDEEPPPAKSQPKRAAATKAARQTQLNFSQSQAKTQTARELSDDEISDDDAFEPMPSSRRR